MKYRYQDLTDDEPKDLALRIPEPLHARLTQHKEISGEEIEEVLVKALDDYFATKVRLEELFDDDEQDVE